MRNHDSGQRLLHMLQLRHDLRFRQLIPLPPLRLCDVYNQLSKLSLHPVAAVLNMTGFCGAMAVP